MKVFTLKSRLSSKLTYLLKRNFANTIKGKEEKPTEKTKGGYTDVQGQQMPNKDKADKFKTPDYEKAHTVNAPKHNENENKQKEVIRNKTENKYANIETKANEGNDKVEQRTKSDQKQENKPQERKTGAQKGDKLEKNDQTVKDVPHGNPKI